jgi:hypothetical protein
VTDLKSRFQTERVVVIEDLLTATECAAVIQAAGQIGFCPARLSAAGRINAEAFVEDAALADSLEARFRALGIGIAIDSLFEIYRYTCGQYITSHRDTGRPMRSGQHSSATLLIYLGGPISGGRTLLENSRISVTPRTGRSMLFSHELEHQAEPVSSGVKFVARAESFPERC